MMGNFVVKRSNRCFNQVPVDQATEWMNRMCKISNGIIGITWNDPARDRFCATWAERSHVSHETRVLLGLKEDSQAISTRKDALPARMKNDEKAVKELVYQFNRFNVFRITLTLHVPGILFTVNENIAESTQNTDSEIPQLIALTTNDVATKDIQDDILCARERGIEFVKKNAQQRLVNKELSLFDPLKKNKSKTFANLYKASVNHQNKNKSVKADRNLIQKLFNASQAGRSIEMQTILQHELSLVPLSLAKSNEQMNSTSKSALLQILSKDIGIDVPYEICNVENGSTSTCVLIDGHALIQKLGKPSNCRTFGDYAEVFSQAVLKYFRHSVKRVDIIFDRYLVESIKSSTRGKRLGKKRPIRKIINHRDVPLPQTWAQFIALDENKADLAQFLSENLSKHNVLPGMEVVTAGGFSNAEKSQSNIRGDILTLAADHEEADTRIILHSLEAISQGFNRLEVICQDTDVLLMLIHHLDPNSAEVWMISGTAKQRKCYPVHLITKQLSQPVIENILGFHAFTGCDTTSSFAGYGKRTCWKVFLKNPQLLQGIGRDGHSAPAEQFVCHLYGATEPTAGVNKGRLDLFQKGKKSLEMLPPTADSFELHLARANYQAKIWLHAAQTKISIESPSTCGGWKLDELGLHMVWSGLPPVPEACIELVACRCKTKCKMTSCKCYQLGQICIPACGCDAENCLNPTGKVPDNEPNELDD